VKTAEGGSYGIVMADYACAPCEGISDKLKAVAASSTLEKKDKYGAKNAFDGDPATAWCEGVDGTGVGQTLTVELDGEYLIDTAFMLGGYFKSESTLESNARVKKIRVRFADVDQTVTVPDPTVSRELPDGYPHSWFEAAKSSPSGLGGAWGERMASKLEFEIVEVWPGAKYEDLCISDMGVLVVDPEAL
jgi:hypothetical protein